MALFGSKKRVLLLGNEGVTLYNPTGNGIEREITLAWQMPNFEQQLTGVLLRKNQGASVAVLFDADHAYRKGEPIVNLSYFDRPLYLKRKLEAAFPNYPIRTYFEVESETKPGEDKLYPTYLYAAISETDNLDRIAAVLLEAGVPVAGVGLLPVESEGLVTALSSKIFNQKMRKSRWAVLIGQHETGGLRQVVVKDGRLALTRMTPVTDAGVSGAGWVEEVMREFKATLTYIARFGYTPAEGLDVIVIGGDAEKQFFDQQKFLPGSNFRCLKLSDGLQLIGMPSVALLSNNFADALHAGWVCQKRALAVSVTVPSVDRVLMPRRVAYWAGLAMAATFVAGVITLTTVYKSYAPLRETYEQRVSQSRLLTLQYETESKVFDAYPVKPNVIRSTMVLNDYLKKSSPSVTPMLNRLRRCLEKDVKLYELSYDYYPSQPSAGKSDGSVNVDAAMQDIAIMSFRFDFTGNMILEQKVHRTATLMEQVRKNFPGYEVKLVTQFGNLSPTGSFSGEFGKRGKDKSVLQSDGGAELAHIEVRGVPQ